MLRNGLQNVGRSNRSLQLQLLRSKSGGVGSVSATRQSKILGKFYGNRLAGTKKRWYPNVSIGSGAGSDVNVAFQASQFGKSNSNGSKQNTRRIAVLNKLFMTHITDLLATGESAEGILGRGLQVTRVKVSADFACINVYWLGGDASLEADLQRSSGQLRHELSQLRLMGEVPRLRFVRDKTGSNINQVESILRELQLSPVAAEEEQEQLDLHKEDTYQPTLCFDVAATARREFYGVDAATVNIPQMRHDVLGLDQRLILDKILTKMRKSKDAWEQHHLQSQSLPQSVSSSDSQSLSKLTSISNPAKFEAFLAKRRERRDTPERKKHRREQWDESDLSTMGVDDELHLLSAEQRQRYTQEDFIIEDDKEKPQS